MLHKALVVPREDGWMLTPKHARICPTHGTTCHPSPSIMEPGLGPCPHLFTQGKELRRQMGFAMTTFIQCRTHTLLHHPWGC